jgi:hypothetical protein
MDCIENDASNNYSIVARVFVAMVMFFTEPFHSNNREIHVQSHRPMGGVYEVCR